MPNRVTTCGDPRCHCATVEERERAMLDVGKAWDFGIREVTFTVDEWLVSFDDAVRAARWVGADGVAREAFTSPCYPDYEQQRVTVPVDGWLFGAFATWADCQPTVDVWSAWDFGLVRAKWSQLSETQGLWLVYTVEHAAWVSSRGEVYVGISPSWPAWTTGDETSWVYGCDVYPWTPAVNAEPEDEETCSECENPESDCTCTSCESCHERGPNVQLCANCDACTNGCCNCVLCARCDDPVESTCSNCERCDGCCNCYVCDGCHERVSELVCVECDRCEDCDCTCETERPRLIANYSVRFHRASRTEFQRNPSRRFIAVEIECAEAQDGEEYYRIARAVETWRASIVTDGSLPETGFEIPTAPANGDKFCAQIEAICNALRHAKAKVSAACGLHVHVDARDFSADDVRRVAWLYAATEDALFETQPETRRRSHYCASTGARLLEALRDTNAKRPRERWHRLMASVYQREPGSIVDLRDMRRHKYNDARYAALNLHSWVYRKTFELRLHTGSVEASKIIPWGMFFASFVDYAYRKPERELAALVPWLRNDASAQRDFLRNEVAQTAEARDYLSARWNRWGS